MNRFPSAWIPLVVAVVCKGFALKALLLIDATALWSDELYGVAKSFQDSSAALLAMLCHDTHPPLYYGLLWGWGQLVGARVAELDSGLGGVREQDQFLMVSRQTDGSLIDLALEHACSISVIGWSRSWAECLLPWLHGEIAVPCANVC